MSSDLRHGVDRRWASMFKRMSSAASTGFRNNRDGVAVVSITALIDADGQLLLWTSPRVSHVEPGFVSKEKLLEIIHELCTD